MKKVLEILALFWWQSDNNLVFIIPFIKWGDEYYSKDLNVFLEQTEL